MIRSGHFGHPGLTAVLDQKSWRPVGSTARQLSGRLAGSIQEPAPASSYEEELPLVSTRTPEAEPLLTPAEVATMFRVDPKTVTRWAKAGKLTSIRTLGGHRRYRETEVRALLGGIPQQRESE